MTTRHHTSGKFAPRGPRQPRTELTAPKRADRKSAANSKFNAQMARANKSGADATPGQIVATVKVS